MDTFGDVWEDDKICLAFEHHGNDIMPLEQFTRQGQGLPADGDIVHQQDGSAKGQR